VRRIGLKATGKLAMQRDIRTRLDTHL
jgi:hypothetical protein